MADHPLPQPFAPQRTNGRVKQRRGHSSEEAKPEMLRKVFKQGFLQRKGSIFACTSLHVASPCEQH